MMSAIKLHFHKHYT